ncbi:CYTH domain-containing protein [Kingella negevensis]|uniref:CYTH domain-containing protein n=1 Tax=Kingella negevensis TaxID=1522312 RepID=UPI002542774D|nr:CYTH domain-containing protein [Kingella negevensis]WII93967.1 CYTH domain-containing protein [Kingella negevensis]
MSNIEIERRFLIKNDIWRQHASAPKSLQQGYINVEKERTIRVRIIGEQAWLTIKGYISDVSRSEFEYPIPLTDAQTMLATLCPFKVQKDRYLVQHNGFTFEIDEFFGDNAPLILAELELPSEETQYPTPDWLGEEITSDGRFTNAYLSKHPYSTWQQ